MPLTRQRMPRTTKSLPATKQRGVSQAAIAETPGGPSQAAQRNLSAQRTSGTFKKQRRGGASQMAQRAQGIFSRMRQSRGTSPQGGGRSRMPVTKEQSGTGGALGMLAEAAIKGQENIASRGRTGRLSKTGGMGRTALTRRRRLLGNRTGAVK